MISSRPLQAIRSDKDQNYLRWLSGADGLPFHMASYTEYVAVSGSDADAEEFMTNVFQHDLEQPAADDLIEEPLEPGFE